MMNRHTEERNGQGSSSSNDNRKRRRNEDAPSGGMVDQNGAGGSKNRHHGGRGRGTRNHDNGGTGGRGNRRGGGGGGRDGIQSKRGGPSGRHNQNRRHNNGGRGRANGHRDRDHGNKRPNSSASAASTLKSNSNYSFNGEHASIAATTTTTTHVVSRSSSTLSSQGDDIITLPSLATATNANASLFTTISNSSPNSNNTQPAIRNNKTSTTTTTTLLSWPNPHSHYIPITQEERLLPALIHWGQSERGMMKDQPPFRLQKLQNVLDHNHRNNSNNTASSGKGAGNQNNNNGKKKNNNSNQSHTSSSSSTTTTQSISLLQSLSLRRHHLKLLNPKYPMSALRLGNEQDIRNAAQLFEIAVDAYLKRHPNVQYLTEEEQRAQYEEKVKGIMPTRKDRKEMKQPPTPDFVMRDGHCVRLVLYTAGDVDDCDVNAKCNKEGVHESNDHALTQQQQQHQQHQQQHPTSINWIEAKMFYGASTIPPNTPNAVGCILPKMKTYVSLYGTGAIVFMYGCGDQLARDLLNVGVIALDARHLDLSAVEKQQRGWCADGWGSILF